jgi:hypothetical protein
MSESRFIGDEEEAKAIQQWLIKQGSKEKIPQVKPSKPPYNQSDEDESSQKEKSLDEGEEVDLG